MSYYLGQEFRSELTPYRYFTVIKIGQKKVTVLEQHHYVPGYLKDNLTRPRQREPLKMTKRFEGTLSYGLKYFKPLIEPEHPQPIDPIMIIGGILSIIGIFIISAYFIVKDLINDHNVPSNV